MEGESRRCPPARDAALLGWAARRATLGGPPRTLESLRESAPDAPGRTGFSATWLHGIATFYERLAESRGPEVCEGTACRLAAGSLRAEASPGAGVQCLGRCYEAPASSATRPLPIPRWSLVSPPIVLRHALAGRDGIDDYQLPSGEEILAAVIASGLRGRGGAAYPTGAKWKAARSTPAPERHVVANGDEGDPGAFIDRLLLEETPHAVLAGLAACARAIQARHGIVYVRAEYPDAASSMRAAIAEASAKGLLPELEVTVVVGAGSYVAGEETALLRSIEGLRAEPWPKPPYPAECGLHGCPTVVQNVETLSLVPWVVAERRAAATKAVCLSGAIARPGVVEIALGTPLRRVLEAGGGGALPGRPWKMALIGGPLGRVLPAADFDRGCSFEALPGLGHGGIVLFDREVDARDLFRHLVDFARRESCGACTPCRVGTSVLSSLDSAEGFERLFRTLEIGSLCAFGAGVARPLRDLLAAFPDEVLR